MRAPTWLRDLLLTKKAVRVLRVIGDLNALGIEPTRVAMGNYAPDLDMTGEQMNETLDALYRANVVYGHPITLTRRGKWVVTP